MHDLIDIGSKRRRQWCYVLTPTGEAVLMILVIVAVGLVARWVL